MYVLFFRREEKKLVSGKFGDRISVVSYIKKSTINRYSNIDKNRTTTFPEMELAVVLGTKVMTCT